MCTHFVTFLKRSPMGLLYEAFELVDNLKKHGGNYENGGKKIKSPDANHNYKAFSPRCFSIFLNINP